jgi:hypothetical protein
MTAVIVAGGLMTAPGIGDAKMNPVELPHESGSRAQVLRTTHLFTIEVVAVREAPWTRGPDGLEQRPLTLEVKLLERLKGTLAQQPAKSFPAVVEQKREPMGVQSDYHGLWSEARPRAGTKYLIGADGEGTDAAVLLHEPPLQLLVDEALDVDVRGACEVEALLASTAAATQRDNRTRAAADAVDAELAEALAAVRWTDEHRRGLHDLFGTYLWARIEPAFTRAPKPIVTALLPTIQAHDTTIELRRALVDGLVTATLSVDGGAEARARVIRGLLTLLLIREAGPLRHQLTEAWLCNLVFPEGGHAPNARTIVADAQERESIAATLAASHDEGAQRLLSWLRGAGHAH